MPYCGFDCEQLQFIDHTHVAMEMLLRKQAPEQFWTSLAFHTPVVRTKPGIFGVVRDFQQTWPVP
jgi:hypothetical protein